ncbi:MAG: TraB/GumN family protein [Hyphomicrobiales bacterium]|nr:TraB/GumN family protein [Hyphomicrobiales bacterium]
MRRFALGACGRLLGLVGVLTFSGAEAETPKACHGSDLSQVEGLAAAQAARADDLINGDGLFWRIEKTGLAPSYLFGTIHSTDESALEIAHRAAQSINEAKIVATELGGPVDTIARANITAATLAKALDRDHDTFEGVDAADRARIEKLIAGLGYPKEFAHHLKPWFLAILTAVPMCEAAREAEDLPEVDQFLAQTGKDLGVKVVGLETPEEQLDAIAALRPEIAATLLILAARDPSLNDDLYATMLRLYRESRPAEILAISDAVEGLSDSERAAQDEFMRDLLQDRNSTMAERAAPLLASGGAFIAVGALHLSGKTGLVERFRADGYTVTKEW